MTKIQCIGAGFDPEYSSCSNLKPKTFRWSTETQDHQVLIDNAILHSDNIEKHSNQKRVGWICESSAIVSHLIRVLQEHTDYIFNEGGFDCIFTSNTELLEKDSRFVFNLTGSNLPWIDKEDWGMHQKTKMCSMVASPKIMCNGHKYRQEVACKFKDKLDLFGGACGSERIGISSNLNEKWNDKSAAICPYMFSLVMENDSVSHYFTEKITDCFATGTVPVYWGATNINEYFNEDGIIQLTEDFDISDISTELYEKMMPFVEKNYETVKIMEMADDELAKKII